MWTYLAILLSVLAIVVVFLRRVVLQFMGAHNKKEEPKEELVEEEPLEKTKVSRNEKAQISEFCERAEKMVKAGKDDEAIKLFVQALSIDSLNEECLHNLAMLYMQKQMFSPASALFKQLVQLKEDALHYSHLGLALYHQNSFEDALGAYKKAVDLDSTRPQRFVSLCQVYRSLEKPHAAVIALNKAIELDEENLVFMLLLADLKSEMEELAEAEEILRGVLDVDPENKEAKEMLKEIKTLSGR